MVLFGRQNENEGVYRYEPSGAAQLHALLGEDRAAEDVGLVGEKYFVPIGDFCSSPFMEREYIRGEFEKANPELRVLEVRPGYSPDNERGYCCRISRCREPRNIGLTCGNLGGAGRT